MRRQQLIFRSEVIRTTPLDAGHLFAAVADPALPGTVTAYFSARTPRAAILQRPGFEITGRQRISGGLRVHGRAEPRAGRVALPLASGPDHAPALTPDRAFFADLRVLFGLTAGQTPREVCDWLRFHVRHHGAEGALILDRTPPGANADLDTALVALDLPGLQRLMVVRVDAPLGLPDLGPEAHPLYAPHAPGRHRLTPPAPDPWAAPFGETVMFELVRHLTLGAARSVLHVETSDLVLPAPSGSVFEAAAEAPEGVVRLMADRVYPWGLRKGKAPGFGDHICRRFDAAPSNPRWCVDLAKAPAETTWRRVRISGIDGASAPILPYLRCMALRHPGAPPARLVPKSALVEDTALLDLMRENFDATPRRAPPETLKAKVQHAGNRTGIVTCMKNEGPFILEWLAHHRAIGVEEFLIYSNDCSDGTDRMLDLLDRKGLVTHRENPYRSLRMKPQHAALKTAEDEPLVQALDWVIVMDVDEFINIHAGDGRLEDLYAAVPQANMISMTWRLFGNGDVTAFHDRLVTEQFTACAPLYARKPHQAWGFKTAARTTGIFRKLGVHRPKGLRPQLVGELRWVNGSGAPMPVEAYRNAWRSTTDTYGYDLVTLNHYALRSAESFLVKRDRGRVNHVDRDQGLAYWFRMNHNGESDRSIQRHLPRLRTELARLMADPEIAAAHAACVAAHEARIAELKQSEKYRAFYAEITSPRMQALSRMLKHFGSGVFFHGPDAIPDAVLDRAGDPDFFFTVKGVAEAD
jgi:hypothetical protein